MVNSQFVMDHWPLQDVTIGKTIYANATRSIVQIDAREGVFAVKIDTEPVPADQALKTLSVFSYLSAQKFPHIPSLLPASDGSPAVYSDQSSMTIMEYIDGGYPEPSSASWRQLGSVCAKLNSLTDFAHPYCVPVQGVIRELTEQAEEHPAKAEFLQFIDLLRPLQNYPQQGLIHGEINLRNSMRRQNGELVLIDWDECGTGATILDAGYPLFIIFLSEDLVFHADWAASFYHAYYSDNPPGKVERDLLFRSGLLHALRYMRFYNSEKRWQRACYAAVHYDELLTAIFGKIGS
jgi:Ser/Thr protein kinase RdoA (MazF antagonist)